MNTLATLSRCFLVVFHLVAPLARRLWRLGDIVLFVPRGVFNPVVSISSSLLLVLVKRYARGVVLDIGCGSGVLGIAAARLPGVRLVLGIDSSTASVAATRVNARLNHVSDKLECTASWRSLARRVAGLGGADTVIINPPYLPCTPRLGIEEAWCGGRYLEVAVKLLELGTRLLRRGGVLLASYSSLSGPSIEELLGSRLKCFDYVARRVGPETIVALACRHG